MKKMAQQCGFTLIETLMYIGLFGVIVVGLLTSAFALIESTGRSEAISNLVTEENFIFAKLDYAFQNAVSIQEPMVNSYGAELELVDAHGKSNIFSEQDGSLLLNGEALNNSAVSISHVTCVRTQDPLSQIETVEIGMSFSTHTPGSRLVVRTATSTHMLSPQ